MSCRARIKVGGRLMRTKQQNCILYTRHNTSQLISKNRVLSSQITVNLLGTWGAERNVRHPPIRWILILSVNDCCISQIWGQSDAIFFNQRLRQAVGHLSCSFRIHIIKGTNDLFFMHRQYLVCVTLNSIHLLLILCKTSCNVFISHNHK